MKPISIESKKICAVIGNNIKQCRKSKNMSMAELAKCINISWQMISKYEMGKNRVSASDLWKIAKTLNISVKALFKDIEENINAQ